MAGNYFHDPRPFYGLNSHNLISMDELFYGRKDPWYMHQMPHGHYDDPNRSRSVEHGRPEQYIHSQDQYREYRRPDFRDDSTFTNFQQELQHNKGNQKNGNHGGGNHGGGNHGNNHGGNHGGGNHGNNHGGNNGKNQKQQKYDSDEEYDDFHGNQKSNKNKGNHDNNHNHAGNKNNHGHGHNHNNSWSDNKGFHGGHKHHHRRSLSLTQTVLKKLGLRDDSSSDSSDDERYRSKNNKGHGHGGHGGHGKGDHKPYTVRFDDQVYGHGHGSNQKHKGVEGLGEDHGSHGKKGGHGGQPQGILKKGGKIKDDGYSSDEENRGHKNNHGGGKGGNQHHGGSEQSEKKNAGHGTAKQLGRSQSMDFRVNLCCENCERKVRKSLKKMDDVDHVLCDQWNNRVVVVGNAKPDNVLKRLRKVKKDTHLWQQHHK